MKTNRIFVGLIAAVLLTSCNKDESTMLTIVNEDGTCSREISIHPYPLPHHLDHMFYDRL